MLVDFTGNVHCRHPYELGGYLWLWSIVAGQASCLLGALLYWQYYNGPGKLSAVLLFAIVVAQLLLTVAAGWGLTKVMNRRFLRGFFEVQTASQYVIAHFNDTEGFDEIRIKIFTVNELLWRPIRQKVQEWVMDNYDEWNETAGWFSDAHKTRIPSGLLPTQISVVGQLQADASSPTETPRDDVGGF